MKYRRLGKTGLFVSEIGFGAWAIGGPAKLGSKIIGWGPVDDGASKKTLETCLEVGINFIDTADVYGWGHSEKLIGEVFKGKRDKVIIASKVGNRVNENGEWIKDFSAQWVRQAIEHSLRRLQTDYIDIYQLHSPHADFEYSPEVFQVFDDLKKEGKIRFYGVSIGPVEHGLQIAHIEKGDVFQVVYNLLQRNPEKELFKVSLKKDFGIIARVPLASGFLTGKFATGHRFHEEDHRNDWTAEQIDNTIGKVEKLSFLAASGRRTMAQASLQFCLAQRAVSTCIPGAKTPAQLIMNAKSSDLIPLSKEELKEIDRVLSA
jgi:aryl-alcohol dehydrogenase-like predicted oxidoreductase